MPPSIFTNLFSDADATRQGFAPIPGGFPSDEVVINNNMNDTTAQNNVRNAPQEEDQEISPVTRVLAIFLQIPLFILYCLISLIILVLSIIKPVLNFEKIYNKRHEEHTDYATELSSLLEELTIDSSSTSVTYTFGSLYNAENSTIPVNLIQESYLDLLNNCANQCKFGILYLHDPLLPNKMDFVNNILCTESFVNCVKKYQCLLWFGDVTKSEGIQVANALKVRHFPFLGIVALKDSVNVNLIGKVVETSDNFHPQKFEGILAKHAPKLLQLIEQRQQEHVSRLVREQQDSRFRESLRRDEAREQLRHEEELREREEINQESLKNEWLIWRRNNLMPEPTGSTTDVSRIAIRLNGNDRIIRKFDASLPIEEIYAFVELSQNNMLSNDEIIDANISNPPPGYTHSYDFKLTTPVPKKQLDEETTIRDEPAIYPSGNIIIEMLYDT